MIPASDDKDAAAKAPSVIQVNPDPAIPLLPPKPAKRFSEVDMYPVLSRFLLDEHGIRTKRIDEKRSFSSSRHEKNSTHPMVSFFMTNQKLARRPLTEGEARRATAQAA